MDSRTEEVGEILDRVAEGKHSPEDKDALKKMVVSGNRNSVQLGRHNVSIHKGRDIHIGDRIYGGKQAEMIRAVLRDVVPALPAWARRAMVLGFILCVGGLGIFFFGLMQEMVRPAEESLREGGVQMGKFAAFAFGTFFIGFALIFAGIIGNVTRLFGVVRQRHSTW